MAGVERADAYEISSTSGGPAYGGTPSDSTVLQAIAELKARGLEVTLAPFLMMDVPSGNGRPDPYGGSEQAAHPWRGRISCHPAPGRAGTPDRGAEADAQVEAFFGTAAVGDFSLEGGEVVYQGPEEWSWRRMVLHYAHLAARAGADGLLVGSELRGLTQVRGAEGYPAVQALRWLAQDCRAVMGPEPMITYAADWSEWTGVQHADDPGGFVFNLDPLWSDPAVSCVGIDWYPPISDWRDSDGHLDALAGWAGAADLVYLTGRIQGGEGFDWFYADAPARAAQARSPIEDGAHGEPWVFRVKDLAGWWSHAHHDRIGGVRIAVPTGWMPGSKPIRLVEFGCGAVDRGGNAPNQFMDPKSSESGAPLFSSGERDDLVQRRLIEATLDAFEAQEANPQASAYPGRMLEAMDVWCWDARPFPDFPAREAVWADGPNWSTGHWLNGRMRGEAADLIVEVARRAGVPEDRLDLSGVEGRIEGLVIDRPMTGLDALEPVLLALQCEAVERRGRIGFARAGDGAVVALGEDDLVLPDGGGEAVTTERRLTDAPAMARVRFIDGQADYSTGAVAVRDPQRSEAGTVVLDLPLVSDEGQVEAAAQALLARAEAVRREARVLLSPLMSLLLEPGDRVRLPGSSEVWRVERIDLDETPSARLAPAPEERGAAARETWRAGEALDPAGPPWLAVLDLPALGSDADDDALRVAVASEPWRVCDVHAGSDPDALEAVARVHLPATVGALVEALEPGLAHRWREGSLVVRLAGAAPESRTAAAVLAGAGRVAVRVTGEDWEILQYRSAEPMGPEVWRLLGLLRGQLGTEGAMRWGAPIGAAVVLLEPLPEGAVVSDALRGQEILWRAAPAGAPPGGMASREVNAVWRGVARRPWAPAHLKARRAADGSIDLRWMRRSRALGDGWTMEPPLLEEAERYRVEIAKGGVVVADHEVTEPTFLWTAAQQDFDCGGAGTGGLLMRVRQGSAVWGWGEENEIGL